MLVLVKKVRFDFVSIRFQFRQSIQVVYYCALSKERSCKGLLFPNKIVRDYWLETQVEAKVITPKQSLAKKHMIPDRNELSCAAGKAGYIPSAVGLHILIGRRKQKTGVLQSASLLHFRG